MFVGWIRDSFIEDLETFSNTVVCDKNLLIQSYNKNENLAFGAYENTLLMGLITASLLEKTVLINNFYYQKELSDEVKSRLIKLLLTNLNEHKKPILILAREQEKSLFQEYGFTEHSKFYKAIYNGGGVAFNFPSSMAKSINNENYHHVMKIVDQKAFYEDRLPHIKDMMKASSLVLSTQFGYQHSYALNKNIIKISPWIMEDMAYDDAEKLLRGLIYHRGLKKLLSFIPSDIDEIRQLYRSYKFDLTERSYLMYKNEKPTINLEMIYGF